MSYIMLSPKREPYDPALIRKAEKRFEWLTSFMIVRFKFIHQILGMMNKVPAPMGTMGVRVIGTGKIELVYDPEFFDTLKDSEATYIFYHECLHVALHHCTSRQPSKNDQLWGVAIDLAVNELIPENDACTKPLNEKGELQGCFVSEFKKKPEYKDIQEKQSAEWYYDFLKKNTKDQGKGDKIFMDGKGNIYIQMDDHSGHAEHELADERVRATVRKIDRNDTWGDVSSATKEAVLAAQVRKINWRNMIKVWFGLQAWKDKQYTRKRPNRKTGYIHPGIKKNYVDRWLIAADTSGSIDQDLLGQWIGVINQLVEELPIDFMQFDCEKTEDPKPYDRRRSKVEFKGRGGTSFQPVMDICDKKHYKGVMILTDGEAAEPTKPKAKVLWVLPPGHNTAWDWGTKVHLQKNA